MSLPDELIRLINERVRNEVKSAFMLNIGGIAGRGGDTVISSMGDVLIRTMGTHKAYYNGVDLGYGVTNGKIWLNAAHTAWMIMNGNILEFHIPGGKWRVVSE